MTVFFQTVINGVSSGAIYAVLALSVALIFKTMQAVNFAAGSMGAVSGFILYALAISAGLGWALGIALALLGTMILGGAVERLIVRPLQGASLFRLVLATMGLSIFLDSATQQIFGAKTEALAIPLPRADVHFAGLQIAESRLVIIAVVGSIAGLLGVLLQRTNLGIGLRAYAQDPVAAAHMGISARAVSRWTWISAAVLGGVGGVLTASILNLSIGFLQPSFIEAMTAAVLGGLSSLSGSVAGGFVLGIIESLSIQYAPSAVTVVLPFLVIIAVLLLRPEGLFGRTLAQRT